MVTHTLDTLWGTVYWSQIPNEVASEWWYIKSLKAGGLVSFRDAVLHTSAGNQELISVPIASLWSPASLPILTSDP